MRKLLAFLIAIASLAPWQALAAVAVESCVTSNVASGTSFTSGLLTVATGNSLVAVVENSSNVAPTGMTCSWDFAGTPQSMTPLNGAAATNGNATVWLFGLRNPTAGNKQLHCAWTGTTAGDFSLCSLSGADTTSDATAFQHYNSASGSSTSSQSVAITSATGNIVIAGHNGVTTSYASVGGTQLFLDNGGSQFAVAANRAPGAASVTMSASFTGTFATVSAGIDVSAPGAGPTTPAAGSLGLLGVGR